MTIKQLIFRSQPVDGFNQDELLRLMVAAQEKNGQNNISGLLVFHNNRFLQLIEGGIEQVDSLYKKIQQDERHTQIEQLLDQTTSTRYMPAWVMALSTDLPPSKTLSDKEFVVPMDEVRSICSTLPEHVKEIFHRFLGPMI